MAQKVVFITTVGTGTFIVPSDFGSLVSIEAIGGGAGAGNGTPGDCGGGGGAYAKSTTASGLAAGSTAYYQVGSGGNGFGGPASSGTDTWFNTTSNSAPTLASQGVLAKAGTVAADSKTAGVGGAASACVGDVKYSGGNGGLNAQAGSHGGGGGAGGPGGAGGNGGQPNGGSNGGGGGAGAGLTTVGGNASFSTPGTNATGGGAGGQGALSGSGVTAGGNGTYWTQSSNSATAGSGGGGGGGGGSAGAGGGLYGGGGGGSSSGTAAGVGAGGQGIIVFTYTQASKVVFITTTGTGSYTIPSDFNTLISVEVIGAGGNGALGSDGNGKAGGGGAYAKSTSITGLTAGSTVYYRVGVGGGTTGTNGTARTWFNTTNAEPASSSTGALAEGGATSSGSTSGAGGASASSVGDLTYSGGNGGSASVTTYEPGGGAAAGPLGNGGAGGGGGTTGTAGGGGGGSNGGSNGSSSGNTTTGGAGGAGYGNGSTLTGGGAGGVGSASGTAGTAGTGGGGGAGGAANTASTINGGDGASGSHWTSSTNVTAGAGGGGGGAGNTYPGSGAQNAGNGGLYGGGGGGSGNPTSNQGLGAQGIIVLTYIYNTGPDNLNPTQTKGFASLYQDVKNKFVSCYDLVDRFVGGQLWMWGTAKNVGVIGDGTTLDKCSPVQTIALGTNWSQVSVGYGNSPEAAAIKTDGTLWTWGRNASGQLGDGTNNSASSPVQTIALGTNWKQVSVGRSSVTALKADGTLWTWGNNQVGQLGNASTLDNCSPVQTIALGTNWKCASISEFQNFVTKTDNTVWTWGCNNSGQLGDGTTIDKSSPVQVIGAATTWKQVAAGCTSSAGIKTDGTLWTWGDNTSGALGIGTILGPQFVTCTNNFQQIAVGGQHMLAIKQDSSVWGWGAGACGVFGNSTITSASSPVQVAFASGCWCMVSAGNNTSGGIKCDGTLWVWGSNVSGILGINLGTGARSSPVQTITGGTTWCQLSIGTACNTSGGNTESANMAAIKTDGTLWMWGCNTFGVLGDCTQLDRSSPVQVVGAATTWKVVSSNGDMTAAIKTDGTLWTWGRNICGALGDNTLVQKCSPVQVAGGGTTWCQVSVAYYRNTCNTSVAAIKTDGTLWVWGFNGGGGLGDGTAVHRSSPVQIFGGGTTWKQVTMVNCAGAAVKTNGTLWIWGCNVTLGDGTSVNKSSPVQTLSGGTTWSIVCMGGSNTNASVMAVKTDGTLWTWGNAAAGVLGNGSTINLSSPVQTVNGGNTWIYPGASWQCQANASSPVQTITGGTTWKCVSVGACNMAAIKTDGTLWVWGSNVCGGLGTNNTVCYSSPVQTITGGSNWKQVSITNSLLSGIKTDGRLWIVGNGAGGPLGNGSTISVSSPVQTVGSGTSWKQVSAGQGGPNGVVSGLTFC